MFFPSLFDNAEELQGRGFRKKRLLALCDMIIAEDKTEAVKTLFEIEVSMLNLVRPKNFMGTESYEIQFEKNYQTVCHGLNSHTNKSVKEMTVLEVYTLMEMLKKNEKQQELNG